MTVTPGHAVPFAVPDPGLWVDPLVVGSAHDPVEHEAERTAVSVVQCLRRQQARGGRASAAYESETSLPRMVRRSGPLPAPTPGGSGPAPGVVAGETVGPAGGVMPRRLAGLISRSQGLGERLPSSVRADLEPAIGADLGAVRVHTGSGAGTLNRGLQAHAFTLGSDIYFRHGFPDVTSDTGLAVLTHEVAHTVQSGSDRTSRWRIRRHLFAPFTGLTAQPGSAEGLVMDKLFFHGLTYAEGGTVGNAVNMEHMVGNGGNSQPGEPAGIWRIRAVDPKLVWANGQTRAATAMHAINGDFTMGTNNEPRNIFMGSAASNTDLHFHKVESPIREAFKENPPGLAHRYEKALRDDPPIAHPTMPNVLVWCKPVPGTTSVPGATSVLPGDGKYNHSDLPGPVTHVVINPPNVADAMKRPRFVQYTVTPEYTYSAYPDLPKFLMENIARSEAAIMEAEKPESGIEQWQIDNQKTATEYLRENAHELFPQTFTCTAKYWVASYIPATPATPWYHQVDFGRYEAEKCRAKPAHERSAAGPDERAEPPKKKIKK